MRFKRHSIVPLRFAWGFPRINVCGDLFHGETVDGGHRCLVFAREQPEFETYVPFVVERGAVQFISRPKVLGQNFVQFGFVWVSVSAQEATHDASATVFGDEVALFF